jgi:hypothetical protein
MLVLLFLFSVVLSIVLFLVLLLVACDLVMLALLFKIAICSIQQAHE